MAIVRMTWFNDAKGYGFGRQEGNSEDVDVFVHFSSIQAVGFRTLDDNDLIECDLVKTAKGLSAMNVRVLEKATNS